LIVCNTYFKEFGAGLTKGIKKAIVDSGVTDKPVTVLFVGGEKSEKAIRWMAPNALQAYDAPEQHVNAIVPTLEYARMK